jgi:hypothetical protein
LCEFSWGDSCTVAPGWQYNCHPNIHNIKVGRLLGANTVKRQTHGGTALLLLLSLLSASCTAKHDSVLSKTPPKTNLSAEKVVALANAEAIRQGRDLNKCEPPRAVYEYTWTVFYEGKGEVKTVGNHFLVWVDDQTSECKLIPGE